MNTLTVLDIEIEEKQAKLSQYSELQEEIRQLGLTANEQGSETFGHDNPILESKKEKEGILASMMPNITEIQQQLSRCMIITENELEFGNNADIGSIVTFSLNGREKTVLLTGMTQGEKLNFRGGTYTSVCSQSPIWSGLYGKQNGDVTEINLAQGKGTITIINVE